MSQTASIHRGVTFSIACSVNVSQDCTITTIRVFDHSYPRHADNGIWTLVSSAEGWDRLVTPLGFIFTELQLDSRGIGVANELIAWIGDQDI